MASSSIVLRFSCLSANQYIEYSDKKFGIITPENEVIRYIRQCMLLSMHFQWGLFVFFNIGNKNKYIMQNRLDMSYRV